jgi:hypothetical protein
VGVKILGGDILSGTTQKWVCSNGKPNGMLMSQIVKFSKFENLHAY